MDMLKMFNLMMELILNKKSNQLKWNYKTINLGMHRNYQKLKMPLQHLRKMKIK